MDQCLRMGAFVLKMPLPLTSVCCRTDSGSRSAAPPSMRNQSLTRSSHVHAHLLPSPTTFRTGIIDLGSHALQCNTVLSCAERTPLKSTCCHALQCNTVLSCITMPARCDGITKQSRFTIPMTMCCHALQCNTVLSCFTMQHGAVMHYNASTMRRHHQTVVV